MTMCREKQMITPIPRTFKYIESEFVFNRAQSEIFFRRMR